MDIGCRFYTPFEISDGIAHHAGKKELVVDLFSGIGNLYKAFLRRAYAKKAIAFDINPSGFTNNSSNKVINKIVDCLNPIALKTELNGYRREATAFILNPPFKRIPKSQELLYWEKFNGFQPTFVTQRIECVAIAAAINAAPKESVIYVIIPEIVLNSNQASVFFELLKVKYSMQVVRKYKRARFSSAEVDVAVIMLKKNSNVCFTKFLEQKDFGRRNNGNNDKLKSLSPQFYLFRGKIRNLHDRKTQMSAKDLKAGGIDIIGNKKEEDLKLAEETNYSAAGDILLARVGPRMIGRVGMISEDCVLTNESLFSIRIPDLKKRSFVYQRLISSEFIDWCNCSAKGTANYFITKDDLNQYIENLISKNDE